MLKPRLDLVYMRNNMRNHKTKMCLFKKPLFSDKDRQLKNQER